jgi:DNA adenine methylase
MTHEHKPEILPVVKWAGGKRWFARNYSHFFPTGFSQYVEPFLGSGAVFFHLQPDTALLSDSCSELIEMYAAIRDNWKRVYEYMESHQDQHSREHYYRVREQRPRSVYARAARLIYLNRTCWNGLYRVNLRGEFNVPLGTKRKVLLDTDRFDLVSQLLERAELRTADFETVIDDTSDGDFLFVDPPYTALHGNNGFIKYNQRLFTSNDQLRLYSALTRAVRRGAFVLLTNANHESIRSLYGRPFSTVQIPRYSIIAANSAYRKECFELVIRSYS